MKTLLTEEAVRKIEKLTNEIIDPSLGPINKTLDKIEEKIKKTEFGKKVVENLYKDPTKLPKEESVKEWAGLMAGASLVMNSPKILSGDFLSPLALSAANAGKGAVIGALQPGGKDTLLKATVIPAGIMAITTPIINDFGEWTGLGKAIDFQPEARVGLTAGIGGALWALRHRKNSKREYV